MKAQEATRLPSASIHLRRRCTYSGFWAWIALLAVLASVPPIGARPSPDVPDREDELEAIRDRITVLQSRLHQVRRQVRGLRGELARTKLEMELQEARVLEARAARELAEDRIATAESEKAGLEREIERLRIALGQRIFDLYRLGKHGYVRLFLSIRSQADVLPGIRQVRFLVARDGRLLEGYQRARKELRMKRAELDRERREAEHWDASETLRFQELERLQRQQARLLDHLERDDRELSREAATLVDKERKLAHLLDFLYGRAGAPLSGTPAQDFRGVLDWPTDGRLVRGFGPRRDPRYQTLVPHNGIELATAPASDVRAVFPGKVVFAAPFEGYGLTAVVYHPGRVFSLYSGLQRLRVRQNDVLDLGAVIGLSGETLYFEIREQNRPVDPLAWLR